jgi:hypothetical protein
MSDCSAITIKEISINKETFFKILRLIKTHEPEIWDEVKKELSGTMDNVSTSGISNSEIATRLIKNLGSLENNYEITNINGEFFIRDKEVGSGEPFSQWIENCLEEHPGLSTKELEAKFESIRSGINKLSFQPGLKRHQKKGHERPYRYHP